MENLMQKLSGGRISIVSAIVYTISQAIILVILHPLDIDPLIFQTTFSKTVFLEILEKWGAPGLEIFMRHYYVDFLHPFIYAILLSSTIAYLTTQLYEKPSHAQTVFFTLPFIAGACDVFENILQLIAISDPVNVSENVIVLVGTLSNTKWSLAGLSIIVICYYGVKLLKKNLAADLRG